MSRINAGLLQFGRHWSAVSATPGLAAQMIGLVGVALGTVHAVFTRGLILAVPRVNAQEERFCQYQLRAGLVV
ncbi:hypothetical protein [Reinekea sp.]|uniref:hypothetical protein n=1 Tax=Reinekea sp. TaxID=1970455 RepID=UPI002A7F181E|nr:hypothetical protein [Reinekea sp.]